MWEKIKTIFSIIGILFTGGLGGFIISLLFRSKADRRRSTGDNERNQSIESGITRTEEHLQRAEDILRGAINRSRKENTEVQDDNSN